VSTPGAAKHFFAHPNALVESDDVGPNTRVWAFAHVMKGARIGADCNIGESVFIESGAILGNNVTVKNGVAVWAGVTAKDDVFLGPNCVFTNDLNPRSYLKKGSDTFLKTLIGEGATVGANATVVCGIEIGRFAFIGAGAVVVRSLPDYSLVVGNPSRQIGWMCYCAQRLPLASDAAENAACTCPHCGRIYRRLAGGLTEQKVAGE
jgi:UDP-2-acetamido-3-amino-2,3-dideoxy-glucuronate N-acetyltransferase